MYYEGEVDRQPPGHLYGVTESFLHIFLAHSLSLLLRDTFNHKLHNHVMVTGE